MFTLTSAAALQIQQAADTSGSQDMALRVAAKIDSDGTLQYGMGFDDPKDEDMKLDVSGVSVVISMESQDLLDETVLDFVELEPGEFNFIFIDGRQDSGMAAQASGGSCGTGSANGCGSGGCGSGGGGGGGGGGCSTTGRAH